MKRNMNFDEFMLQIRYRLDFIKKDKEKNNLFLVAENISDINKIIDMMYSSGILNLDKRNLLMKIIIKII